MKFWCSQFLDKAYFGYHFNCNKYVGTGKSLSEALIFESTNQQYDDRLFIELQVK